MKITENTATNAVERHLMEEILGHKKLMKACQRVIRNKGSYGIDGMEVGDFMPYFLKHEEEIRKSLFKGKYKPKPVCRVEIPKQDGT